MVFDHLVQTCEIVELFLSPEARVDFRRTILGLGFVQEVVVVHVPDRFAFEVLDLAVRQRSDQVAARIVEVVAVIEIHLLKHAFIGFDGEFGGGFGELDRRGRRTQFLLGKTFNAKENKSQGEGPV